MLSSINLVDRDYNEMMAEAIMQIPLYTDEWTNFNTSEPGVTVLQNLSAFNLLQLTHINEVTDDIRRRLLKLVGMEAGENRAASVLLAASGELTLPAHKKLRVGSMRFETASPLALRDWRISKVYTERRGEYRDITYLLGTVTNVGAAVFGQTPEAGCSLCCILTDAPETGREILLYSRAQDDEKRTPFQPGSGLSFAETRWQYYTAGGWTDIEAEDGTRGFLVSGTVRLKMPETEPAVFEGAPEHGYAIRCVLERADYDLPPRIRAIAANLFEAFQRDTRAATFSFIGGSTVTVDSDMARYENMTVYCRESKGELHRLYRQYNGRSEHGRFYLRQELEDGRILLTFDKKRFGYGPGRGWGAVRVSCCDEEMINHRMLGTVCGYENQSMDVETARHIIPAGFSVIAELKDKDDETGYLFAAPGETDPDQLCYSVLSEEGRIVISQPGLGQDCRLFVGDCAVTEGERGNIREGSQFTADFGGESFTNPAPGTGGCSFESSEQLRRRFVRELKHPTAAVMAPDYEELVRATPGLCVHKVRAVGSRDGNLVRIAVKPYSEERFPRLSPLYLGQIRRWIEPKRMITTRVELLQPKYVPIDVHATVYTKSYFQNARSEIEQLLRRELDYVESGRGFGELISFNELYRRMSELDCVESVFELKLIPRTRSDVTMSGSDVQPAMNCLCYMGTLTLELSSHTR